MYWNESFFCVRKRKPRMNRLRTSCWHRNQSWWPRKHLALVITFAEFIEPFNATFHCHSHLGWKRDLSLIIFNTFSLRHIHPLRCSATEAKKSLIHLSTLKTQIKSISKNFRNVSTIFLLLFQFTVAQDSEKKGEVNNHLN